MLCGLGKISISPTWMELDNSGKGVYKGLGNLTGEGRLEDNQFPRSMDNIQTDWGVDWSTFCLAGHADGHIRLKMK